MAESKLCSWRQGDILSAQRLNMMTCAINANTALANTNASELSQLTSGSFNAVGGLPDGRYISQIKDEFMSSNRGVMIDDWDFKATETNKGLYVRPSGFENALENSYPDSPSLCKLSDISGATHGKEIIQTIETDAFGNVTCSKITLELNAPTCNNYWSGVVKSEEGETEKKYKFYRRLGRIVDSCFEMSQGSTPLTKVRETNDTIMPILPARPEADCHNPERLHSVSLIDKFIGNSILIKNIANAGGLKFDTSNSNRVQMCSGVEFYKACVKESSESGETTTTTTWPDIPKHIEPTPFNVTIACIPVKEQHYKWCSGTSSWNPVNASGDSTSGDTGPVLKSSVQIKAQSLCGSNWKIGWTSSGGVEIPVYDFFPAEAKDYTAGRGINICEVNENIGTDEEPNEVKRYYICNTMKFCAGCGVTICEPTCGKYKISSCKAKKVIAGEGICVTCENCSYKISAKPPALKLTAGDGICVSGSGLCWKITNTAMQEAIEIVGGCGICVTQTGNKYKVSAKAPCSDHNSTETNTYIFDSAWFTVSR